MKWFKCTALSLIVSIFLTACITEESSIAASATLDLWNEGTPKTAIAEFVKSVTDESSPHYLRPAERVAVFDMDGTILIERPMYVIFDFALHRMGEKMAAMPVLKNKQPYKAIAEKDMVYLHDNAYGTDGMFDVLLYATDGLSDEEYNKVLGDFLKSNPHERFGKPSNELLYAPVVELIDYLHANDFLVYICSGSDPQFTRFSAAEALGIPPEHVIGTTILTQWDGEKFVRQHEFVKPLNDMAGKPVNIRNKIGRIPVMVVGNSRGDLEMLNYSKAAGHSLQLVVNHDDPDREYEYNAEKMKKLCAENDWIEVSMKTDFKTVFKGVQ